VCSSPLRTGRLLTLQAKHSHYPPLSRGNRAILKDPCRRPSLISPLGLLANEQYLNLDNGFYVFPPNPEGLVKVAIHAAGYCDRSQAFAPGVSVPRTKLSPGAEDGFIPKAMVEELREGLRDIFPELAKKDFEGTRLCW
jgi:hypothetical protein